MKIQILITYACNNGHKCSCCKNDWTECEVYELKENQTVKDLIQNEQKSAILMYETLNFGRYKIIAAYVLHGEINLKDMGL